MEELLKIKNNIFKIKIKEMKKRKSSRRYSKKTRIWKTLEKI